MKRRFSCNLCSKSYTQKTKLKFHQANEHGMGECLAKCAYCSRKFTSTYARREHEVSIHMGARRFKCEDCGQGFTRASHLYSHKRSHHNSLKLKCDRCQATFSYIQSLREHQTQCGIAEEDRVKYGCSQCAANFTTKRAARVHEKSTHGDELHVCEICGTAYKYKSSYNKHMKNEH